MAANRDVAASPYSSQSSLPTSAHFTPDSDDSESDSESGSGSDAGGGRSRGDNSRFRRGLLPQRQLDAELGDVDGSGGESYELQDRSKSGSGRYARAAAADDDDDDGGGGRNAFYEQENNASESSSGGGGRGREGRTTGGRRSRSRDRGVSASSVASFELYTPDEERAVVRKFDRRLVLFLSLCYMLSFLDRSNIGNARIAGMEEDLQTAPPRDEWYEWALSAFYLAYIAFEWMSLLWRVIPAHIYVAAVVASWGVFASLQAVCTSYPALIFLRAALGVGEAAFTGVPFYLSFFFKRDELAFRTAMFISAAPLATTFASSLAWLILKVAEDGPIAPWRLLFLIEGFPSVVIATIAWSVIPDSPGAASYLTDREKKVARLRLRHERKQSQRQQRQRSRAGAGASSSSLSLPSSSSPAQKPANGDNLRSKDVLSVVLDPKAWITAAMFFLANMAYSSLPVFLPTVLRAMGFGPQAAQGLAAPPYLLAFAAVLVTARLSDRAGARAPFVAAHAAASALGYAGLALARPLALPAAWRYAAVYPAAVGFFNVVVLVLAWSVNNQPDDRRRGAGFALLQLVGQCGPLVGTRLYPVRDAPFFERGMWACAAAMLGVAVLALLLRYYLARANRGLEASASGAGRSAGADLGAITDEEAQGLVSSYDSRALALDPRQQPARLGSLSPQSVRAGGTSGFLAEGVDSESLEERLRGLNDSTPLDAGSPLLPGKRIFEYENALAPSTPRKALGFKVIRRDDAPSSGVLLSDFPNEILTHILSHLHPDSHAAVALVSKRFYSLVTTPHAWRMAFQRFFPGHDALVAANRTQDGAWELEDSDVVRSEVRHFTRLTPHASWRSEYLLRTRLLRSLARGKPGTSLGGIGSSSRTSQSGKKSSAVLTYNTKLPSMVTHLHATFTSSSKKSPRVIHGAGDFCVASASDPTIGKVEKWGLDDPFAFAQLDEVVPQILPYGVGEGPAAVPNIMDVSQPYGIVGGEGFPGGRVFYRPSNEFRGKYLGQGVSVIEAHPDIPKIPELSEGICSVWIAKSPAVPSLTQSMVGMLTGSSLGVVTAYALGYDPSGPRYASGEISARWVLSPGVPIIALKVDDNYNHKRKTLGRVWAVALNALGEVYYLTQPPTPPATKSKADDSTKLAWHAGRTAYWQLVEVTRRQARSEESERNVIRGTYSPRSPSNGMNLKKEQLAAEAREIERFLHYKPSHFRKVCTGWDMRRRLQVDFAGDDEHGAGESIFVINCGLEEDQTSSIIRYSRARSGQQREQPTPLETPIETPMTPSIFGGSNSRSPSPKSTGPSLLKKALSPGRDLDHVQITTSNEDCSTLAIVGRFEDTATPSSVPATPTAQSPSDIPGRCARLFGIGTNTGKILLWNMREAHASDGVHPVRVIQTESPEISCLALSALYLVHGGIDGLVQTWDPLASTLEPVRTLNSRSQGRLPRHMLIANPTLRNLNFAAAGAIHLDPDATVLRGIIAFGTFVRYWSYSSSSQATGRKRRLRHSDVHGRATGRRHGGGVQGYIAAEAEELRIEQEHKDREQAHLRARFGVGLAELTEAEALQYAEIMSQEAFLLDEQRRASASDTGSIADLDTTSTSGSTDTLTPEPSVTGLSPPVASSSNVQQVDEESDYDLQIQTALRLSLLESAGETAQSPRGNSSAEYEFPITYKEKRGKQPSSITSPPSSHTRVLNRVESSSSTTAAWATPRTDNDDDDDDLQFALKLSLAEEESRKSLGMAESAFHLEGPFPNLEAHESVKGKGKGKAV
ncbi:hypothetical protein SLS62_003928 [Diatrype stigma]|uniref:F-box domain-containing protein n=1 Tax=Diatrype stigma TaxID=117547 RepID=A0AAN9YTK2_9PEZI